MAAELEAELSGHLAEIERLAELIEGFGEANGVPSKLVFNLNLALDELITNIVGYAYPDDDPARHVIRVRITLDDAGLTTVLSDDGRAYDPFSEARAPDISASIDGRPIGGLGVHLVRTLIGDVAYERVDGLNRVTLRQAV